MPVGYDRLHRPRDIAAVLRGRRQRAGRYAVVHVRSRPEGGTPRLTAVASRRVGSAVSRNRAKRVLREAGRATPWVAGTDVVLVARGACAEAGAREVNAEICRLAADLGVLHQEAA